MEIIKTEVTAKPRKLKATWTIDTVEDWFIEPSPQSNKFKTVDDLSREYPYGLDGSDVSFWKLDKMKPWLAKHFADNAYRLEGDYTHDIWFAEEKHRTLTLLQWS